MVPAGRRWSARSGCRPSLQLRPPPRAASPPGRRLRAVGPRHEVRRPMRFGHVAEVAEDGDRVVPRVLRRRRQGVVDEVAVERLVVVGVAGELRPGLALVEVDVVASAAPAWRRRPAPDGRRSGSAPASSRTGRLEGRELGRVEACRSRACLLDVRARRRPPVRPNTSSKSALHGGHLVGGEEASISSAAVAAPGLEMGGRETVGHQAFSSPSPTVPAPCSATVLASADAEGLNTAALAALRMSRSLRDAGSRRSRCSSSCTVRDRLPFGVKPAPRRVSRPWWRGETARQGFRRRQHHDPERRRPYSRGVLHLLQRHRLTPVVGGETGAPRDAREALRMSSRRARIHRFSLQRSCRPGSERLPADARAAQAAASAAAKADERGRPRHGADHPLRGDRIAGHGRRRRPRRPGDRARLRGDGAGRRPSAGRDDAWCACSRCPSCWPVEVLLSLAANGCLKLDDPVQRYAPASCTLPLTDPVRPITLANLATHTSGLPRNPEIGIITDRARAAAARWAWLGRQQTCRRRARGCSIRTPASTCSPTPWRRPGRARNPTRTPVPLGHRSRHARHHALSDARAVRSPADTGRRMGRRAPASTTPPPPARRGLTPPPTTWDGGCKRMLAPYQGGPPGRRTAGDRLPARGARPASRAWIMRDRRPASAMAGSN